MSVFQPIDLTRVPPPDVVEPLSYEQVLAEMRADLKVRDPDFSAGLLESDPAVKVLEAAAMRETLLRQRVNDAAGAVMLATATGADLDNIAARYNVARLIVDPGDPDALPPEPAVYETDDRLRFRAQMAFEGLSTAGPEGAYIFHAVSADARIPVVAGRAGVSAVSPKPAEVLITVMSKEGSGVPGQDILDAVTAALNGKDVRPLTDRVTVQAAANVNYAVTAEIDIYDGPDKAVVLQNSINSVTAFTAAQKLLGEMVTIDGLHKALRVAGVRKVALAAPSADVTTRANEFPSVTAITVTEAAS